MEPTIGRIVHYFIAVDDVIEAEANAKVGEAFPAMIVRVNDDRTVTLQVFLEGGHSLCKPRLQEGSGRPGTWKWPTY